MKSAGGALAANGLPSDTIHIKAKGSAGQSVGAWLAHGCDH